MGSEAEVDRLLRDLFERLANEHGLITAQSLQTFLDNNEENE